MRPFHFIDGAAKKKKKTAELIRDDEAVAHSLQTITGRDPAWFVSMLPNVERLVVRSREMEAVTVSYHSSCLSSSKGVS